MVRPNNFFGRPKNFTCENGCTTKYETRRGADVHMARYCKLKRTLDDIIEEKDEDIIQEEDEDINEEEEEDDIIDLVTVNNYAPPNFIMEQTVIPAQYRDAGKQKPTLSGVFLHAQRLGRRKSMGGTEPLTIEEQQAVELVSIATEW